MWRKNLDRKEFIEILQQSSIQNYVSDLEKFRNESLHKGQIGLVWSREPISFELPNILIIRKSEMEDFFAWANTYISNWCPISYYFHVISDDQSIGNELPLSNANSSLFESASIGLILGDATARAKALDTPNTLTISDLKSTFSYVIAQGVIQGFLVREVTMKWVELMKAGDYRKYTRAYVDKLLVLWEAVIGLAFNEIDLSKRTRKFSQSTLILIALKEISEYGELRNHTWRKLIANVPSDRLALYDLKSTNETRVLALEEAMKELFTHNGGRDSDLRYFVIGYLASLLSPGTLRHASLLLEYGEEFSLSVLWLGLIAGLHKNRKTLLSREGRLLWKHLCTKFDLDNRPICDVSLDELQVLQRAKMVNYPLGSQENADSDLAVQLLPGVVATVRWDSNISFSSGKAKDLHQYPFLENFRETTIELDRLHRELEYTSNRIRRLLRKIDKY